MERERGGGGERERGQRRARAQERPREPEPDTEGERARNRNKEPWRNLPARPSSVATATGLVTLLTDILETRDQPGGHAGTLQRNGLHISVIARLERHGDGSQVGYSRTVAGCLSEIPVTCRGRTVRS